jgi:8-amino-7-oxononanoate synthase
MSCPDRPLRRLALASKPGYRQSVTTDSPASVSGIDETLAADLAQLRARDLERSLRRVWNRRGAVVETERGTAVDFSSNDYLGLASDPRLAAAAKESVEAMGVGAGAARLISGNTPEHDALDEDIAHWFGAERALSFSTGYAANVGTISALVGRGDVIFSDALNHASVIDGCRLSRADVHVYPHADVDALATMLDRHRGSARRALIVTDGLFSMDGDSAPIAEIVDLARRFDAWTYVDDAHAIGVAGPDGLGTAAAAGLHGEIDVTVGTLGKAFGAAGAFVYGSDVLARFLLNTSRSFIFSTAMMPAQAAAAREGLRIARAEPERRERLLKNAKLLSHPDAASREARRSVGSAFPVRHHERSEGSAPVRHHERSEGSAFPPVSPIIPVMIGDDARTMRIGAALAAEGFLVGAIRPPTVPAGTARLRITASAAHTDDQIAGLGEALARALRT